MSNGKYRITKTIEYINGVFCVQVELLQRSRFKLWFKRVDFRCGWTSDIEVANNAMVDYVVELKQVAAYL